MPLPTLSKKSALFLHRSFQRLLICFCLWVGGFSCTYSPLSQQASDVPTDSIHPFFHTGQWDSAAYYSQKYLQQIPLDSVSFYSDHFHSLIRALLFQKKKDEAELALYDLEKMNINSQDSFLVLANLNNKLWLFQLQKK